MGWLAGEHEKFVCCSDLGSVTTESFDRRDLTKSGLAAFLCDYVQEVSSQQAAFDQCKYVVNFLMDQNMKLKDEISTPKSTAMTAQESIIS